ncbi:MAG: tRNA 2-thiouridine(34) synthase MnmA [Fusobacteria bacterium]|nr:tRNA 2-thiouridine(34) synthase MnmA [Fusobacteriota bacterium]
MKKVLLALSGGLDSSIAAFLLKKSGYEVIGITFNFYKNVNYKETIENSEKIADFLDIKLLKREYYEEFNEKIVKEFIKSYNMGITPSPCILCDEIMKIGKLYNVANEFGIDYIATGHYADKYYDENLDRYFLKRSNDIKKDQTYMLYRIEPKILEKMLFPLQNYTKEKLRNIAKENKFPNFNQKDSQGICFAENGYIEFLNRNSEKIIKSGDIIDENGNYLGKHRGYQLYTIGQRRGLGINSGRPYFVIDIIPALNKIVVGDYDKLYRKKIKVNNYKLYVDIVGNLENIIGRPRFSSNGNLGKIYIENKNLYFEYYEANTQNTDGQHIVFYKDDIIIGGGIISGAKDGI